MSYPIDPDGLRRRTQAFPAIHDLFMWLRTISLNSASVGTKARRLSRSISITFESWQARTRAKARRPESVLISPVKLPGPTTLITVSCVKEGRITSSSPEITTKTGIVFVSKFHQHVGSAHRSDLPMPSETLYSQRAQCREDLFDSRRSQRNWSD
jgi:hypothetical protein